MAAVTSYTKIGIDDLLEPILHIPYSVKTATYTLVEEDGNTRIGMNVAGANDLIVPEHADEPIPIDSFVIVHQRGPGLTTIVEDGSVVIHSLNDYLTSAGQYSRIILEKVAANEWYASGDLAGA